jgi:hypothetical protein
MARNNPYGQPSLEDLTIRFLAARSAAAAAVEPSEGEVEPHEVAAGFRVDPRAAWTDATTEIATVAGPRSALPPDWAKLVNLPGSAFAVPFAAGNFPQRVRDLEPLLTRFNPSELRPRLGQTPLSGLSALRDWVQATAGKDPILAGGVATLIGDFETAEDLLPADAGNERAALLWQRGLSEQALQAWSQLPESPAVLFNRGMALFFLGRAVEASPVLAKAAAAIPEESGWNSLARLYLAVAQIHA